MRALVIVTVFALRVALARLCWRAKGADSQGVGEFSFCFVVDEYELKRRE